MIHARSVLTLLEALDPSPSSGLTACTTAEVVRLLPHAVASQYGPTKLTLQRSGQPVPWGRGLVYVLVGATAEGAPFVGVAVTQRTAISALQAGGWDVRQFAERGLSTEAITKDQANRLANKLELLVREGRGQAEGWARLVRLVHLADYTPDSQGRLRPPAPPLPPSSGEGPMGGPQQFGPSPMGPGQDQDTWSGQTSTQVSQVRPQGGPTVTRGGAGGGFGGGGAGGAGPVPLPQ